MTGFSLALWMRFVSAQHTVPQVYSPFVGPTVGAIVFSPTDGILRHEDGSEFCCRTERPAFRCGFDGFPPCPPMNYHAPKRKP